MRNGDEHQTVGQVGVTIGMCYARLGRASEAIEWLQNAAATFRRIDDADGLVTALNDLGLVYKSLREWREATRFLEQALKIDERAGLYARMAAHNQNLGLIRYYLGQWDLAEENFRKTLQISRDTGHLSGEAAALMALGRLARRRRQFEKATEQFRTALALATQVGARREAALAQEFLAEWNSVATTRRGLGAARARARRSASLAPQGWAKSRRASASLLLLGRADGDKSSVERRRDCSAHRRPSRRGHRRTGARPPRHDAREARKRRSSCVPPHSASKISASDSSWPRHSRAGARSCSGCRRVSACDSRSSPSLTLRAAPPHCSGSWACCRWRPRR
jgi:hypothetical protein